jgi:hypothetical protein
VIGKREAESVVITVEAVSGLLFGFEAAAVEFGKLLEK